ncbi:hypothetical protein GWK47_046678 [Chionoecetes opilio]|uniref:HTH CENPB-type domain-containing protein n=1 Tax=Chionoecetes opilio TaxID=41210 RepID=A0A8J5CTJ1_CHIOP|nr:hypothetical protein GWK47_046678 [Chionoecetes opilio]
MPYSGNQRSCFDRPPRRHSLDEGRTESVLSLRSPISSACSSVPGTAPGSRVPSLPPITGAAPFMPPHTSPEGRHGSRDSNNLLSRDPIMEKMECLLHAWLEGQNQAHAAISKALIKEKALALWKRCKEEHDASVRATAGA